HNSIAACASSRLATSGGSTSSCGAGSASSSQFVNDTHLLRLLELIQQLTQNPPLTRQRSRLRPIRLTNEQLAQALVIGAQVVDAGPRLRPCLPLRHRSPPLRVFHTLFHTPHKRP